MAAPTYDLGPLTGGRYHQYANAVGQIFYYDNTTNTSSYAVPIGSEDRPGDTWSRDLSKSWPQWLNTRTGRATLIDPNPPPPQTYLDLPNVKAAIDLLERVPDSEEHVCRRPMGGILRFMFPESEGYDVVQEVGLEESRADFCTFKISRKPGGTFYQYDFLLTESKRAGKAWGSTEDQLLSHLSGNGNDSKNCYGMIQMGLVVQFYKHEDFRMTKMGRRLHLVQDVHEVIRWGAYLKQNPLALV